MKLHKRFFLSNELYDVPTNKSKLSILRSVRVLVALLSLLGTSIMYITRVNLNIAILAMVKSEIPVDSATSLNSLNQSANYLMIDHLNQTNAAETKDSFTPQGEFDWSPPEQGVILGSFFYGYSATQVIGGRLAETYLSPTKLIFLALFSSGFINLMTPVLARNSTFAFVCSRIVLGAFQGLIYPAFYCLFSRWIPSNERSTFIPWLDAGSTIGTILTSASSGQIIVWFAKLGGWPVVFYFSSALALIWCAFWTTLVRSNPEEHPLINEEELVLLLNDQKAQNKVASVSPRWTMILTSRIFYGVLATKICYGVVFDFVTQKIPAYLQDVVHLPVNENGLAFSFVMIGYMFALLSGGAIADMIIIHSSFDKCHVRKLFQLMSGLIMSVSLLLIPFAGSSKWTNVLLLTACMLGYGFTSGGDLPLIADISGPLSGTVFAIMNTLCSISGFAVPYLVGVVIESEPSSIRLWKYLFFTGAILIFLGTASFLIFASSDLQTSWCEESTEYNKPIDSVLEYKNSLIVSDKLKCKYIPRYDTFI